MKHGLTLFLTLALFGSLARAQSADRVEIFGGYSHVTNAFSFLGGGANGWNASVDLRSKLGLSFVADFSGFYKTYPFPGSPSDQANTHLYLFGPQYSIHLRRFTPFAHFLFGAGHINDTSGSAFNQFSKATSFAYGFGGGGDFSLASHWALRVQADYLHTSFETADVQLQHVVQDGNARISTGIVFRF